MDELYTIKCKTIQNEEVDLSEYQDKTLLIVNTASKCGYTPQFEGLEELHKQYAEKGLVVLGFPCNQFRRQDPGTDSEIEEFCKINYGVSFKMFSKIDVNGADTHPLYALLKSRAPGILGTEKIKWNFTKFLVSPGGKSIKRFATTDEPKSMAKDIENSFAAV